VLRDITKVDSQVQEIRARGIVIDRLLSCGFEVAVPVRDKGVDFLIYRENENNSYRKIQLKSSIGETFSFSRKYLSTEDLVCIYVMNLSMTDTTGYRLFVMRISDVLDFMREENINYNRKGWAFKKCIKQSTLNRLERYEIESDYQLIKALC